MERVHRTHCSRGHDLAQVGTYPLPNGSGTCRACALARAKARRQGIKSTQRVPWPECPRGHEMTGDNIGVNQTTGRRFCVACEQARRAERRKAMA